MSEIIDDEFEQIVELDIRKAATEEQVEELMDDPESWRDVLLSKLRNIETQLSDAKAKAIKYKTVAEMKEYAAWKAQATAYKAMILDRLTEAKACLKELNIRRHDAEERSLLAIMQGVASELSSIRKLLEAKL